MEGASELWYVQLSDGDVHRVTLDQLDEGFQAGHIDGDTMVLAAGAKKWTKLGEIAGIDDVAEAPPPPPPPVPLLPMAPMAPMARVAPPIAVPIVVPIAVQPPPPVALLEYAPPPPPLIESHRPVSVDLSDLEYAAGLPNRSRKSWVLGLLGVAALGAIAGVAVERPGILKAYAIHARTHVLAATTWIADTIPRKLFGKPAPAPPAPASPPPTVEASILGAPTTTPPPAQPGAPPPAAEPAAPAPQPTMTEAKPPARAVGSKARPRKAHPAKVAGAAAEPPSKAPSSPSFTTKGNKFDPLSSSIQ